MIDESDAKSWKCNVFLDTDLISHERSFAEDTCNIASKESIKKESLRESVSLKYHFTMLSNK